jgi:UDP-N-acetylglucosamine 3-dehydrogenase
MQSISQHIPLSSEASTDGQTKAKPVRTALIGCGAIAEMGYLPAAQMTSNLRVTHVVDLDRGRARDVARRFRIPNALADYRDVFGKVDAVVVATPPKSHAPISIECLGQGLHVLCEKPLAPSLEEAEAMIEASRQSDRHLGVGMVRRLSSGAQLMKTLVHIGVLGEIDRFHVEDGSQFNWPLRTAHIFEPGAAGGVLVDTGFHLLDLLCWFLGSSTFELKSYRDDNLGGVESNAVVELSLKSGGRDVMGTVELSFTRRLENSLKIYGSRGWAEMPTYGGPSVMFHPCGEDSMAIHIQRDDAVDLSLIDLLAIQLTNFARSIQEEESYYVSASEVIGTMAIIEACRKSRELMTHALEIRDGGSVMGSGRNG